ncbi:MAG TPA: hypothetical protein VK013_09895 [Myxococcaceae bacterium]|nr:hypothetical protein [Myxococcaceae bacterium]
MRTPSPASRPAHARARWSGVLLALALVSVWPVATRAEALAHPERHYAVETTGTSTRVKAGEAGTFVLRVQAHGDAYISPRTPLSLVLGGEGVTFEQSRLGLADVSAGGPVEGSDSVTPRFDVPFRVSGQGPARIEAKLTFFLCTPSSCTRQVRDISVPIRAD